MAWLKLDTGFGTVAALEYGTWDSEWKWYVGAALALYVAGTCLGLVYVWMNKMRV